MIVVDLNLPNVSGLDVCRQITQNNPRVKVIVITAMADDAIRDEALAAGASGFFHKSAAHELIVAIRRIWGVRQPTRARKHTTNKGPKTPRESGEKTPRTKKNRPGDQRQLHPS